MSGWGILRDLEGSPLGAAAIEERALSKEHELERDWTLPDIPRRMRAEGTLSLPRDLRVAVIGAGFSGLAAAWYLHVLGVEVVVFEFSDHVGGRVLTDRGFIPDKNAEAGAELIGRNHPMWWRLSRLFNLRMVPLTTEEEYEEKLKLKVRLRFAGKELSDAEKEQVKKTLRPILDRIGAEAKNVSPTAPWTAKDARALDLMSLSARFDRPDMFGPGPRSLARQVLEFKIANDNCAAPNRLSYLSLLTAVSAGRVGNDPAGLRGYWDHTETHRCGDGNQALAKRLADVLGARVRLSAPVRRVEVVKASGVRPVIVETKAGRRDDFDYVVLSAPAPVWKDIVFDPPFKLADRTISDGPAVKYMSRWPDAFWVPLKVAPSALWDELGSVWETTDKQPLVPDFGLTVFSGGTFVLPRIEDYRRLLAVLYQNPNAARDERLVDWPAVPGIRTGYAVPTVGQVTGITPKLLEPHQKRIYFSGEQASPGLYGYMEGALQAGARSARDIVRRAATLLASGGAPAPAPPTPGATIKRIDGADYVVVRIDRLFPGPPPSIAALARTLHLRPDVVFADLLGFRSNAPAVIGLFRDQIGGPLPGLEEARRQLRVEGSMFTANALFPEGTETPYLAWPVEPDAGKPIVLPLAEGFRRVLDEAARQRRRQTRLAAIQPQLDALRGELTAIKEKAEDLTSRIELCRVVGQRNARDAVLLETLDGLLGAMLATPKEPPPADDRRDVEELRGMLDALRREAHRHMLLEPVDPFEAGQVAKRNQEAAELLALIEAPGFVAHVRTLAANRDIVPTDVYGRTLDTVGLAVQALLASPEGERTLDRHVLPMIDAVAAVTIDLDGVAAQVNPGLDAAIRRVPTAPAPTGPLQLLVVGAAGLVPQANTLVIGVMQWGAPHLLARLASNRDGAIDMAGRLYRLLVTCASVHQPVPGVRSRPLSLAEQLALLRAIDEGNLARLHDVHWTARLQSSGSWAWVLAVCNLVSFLAAVTTDDANTLRRWAQILGTGTDAARGVAEAVQRWSTLVRNGIVRGPLGKALGVVGGIAAIVSGVLTAMEEEETGDRVGMWVAIGGATAGALSVAGLLLSAGGATTATVLGAPIGVVLTVAGAVIGIGAGIVALVRAVTTEGSQVVFEAVLERFNRVAGPYRDAAAVRPSLLAAFTVVQTSHHPVDFWDVHPDSCPQLADLGFAPSVIAHIVDESEAEVVTRLRRTERDTEPVPVGAP